MNNNFKKKRNGFTLVELLIGLIVGALVMLAVYMAMVMSQRTSAGVGRKVITQQDTRAVLDIMASEIAMASFNPNPAGPGSWKPGTMNLDEVLSCPKTAFPFDPVNKGIFLANANNLYIAMDLNTDRVIGCSCVNPVDCDNDVPCAGQNEYILYSYNAANREITRRTRCGNAVAILGGTALGSNVVNGNAGINLFQYFNAAGAPAASIRDIRRIRINIVAETSEIDLNTKQPKRMIYSTDVLIRNHMVTSKQQQPPPPGGGAPVGP